MGSQEMPSSPPQTVNDVAIMRLIASEKDNVTIAKARGVSSTSLPKAEKATRQTRGARKRLLYGR
jgi:hypothetical protein